MGRRTPASAPAPNTVVWYDAQGHGHDLGAWEERDTVDLRWALALAYRLTRDRGDRVRLTRVRSRVEEWAKSLL